MNEKKTIDNLVEAFAGESQANRIRSQRQAQQLGVDFEKVEFTTEDYPEGNNIGLEHGTVDSETNVTNDDQGELIFSYS